MSELSQTPKEKEENFQQQIDGINTKLDNVIKLLSDSKSEELDYTQKRGYTPKLDVRNDLFNYENDRKPMTIQAAPKIVVYNGDDDPKLWLSIFNNAMRKQSIYDEQMKLDELSNWLRGRALYWLTQKAFKSFNKFQTSFLEEYSKDPRLYKAILGNTKQEYNENLQDYLERIQKKAKPARLGLEDIKYFFINGIKDEELKDYAKSTFLFLNQDTTLERIIIALEDKALFLKRRYIRQKGDIKQNDKEKFTKTKPYNKFKANNLENEEEQIKDVELSQDEDNKSEESNTIELNEEDIYESNILELSSLDIRNRQVSWQNQQSRLAKYLKQRRIKYLQLNKKENVIFQSNVIELPTTLNIPLIRQAYKDLRKEGYDRQEAINKAIENIEIDSYSELEQIKEEIDEPKQQENIKFEIQEVKIRNENDELNKVMELALQKIKEKIKVAKRNEWLNIKFQVRNFNFHLDKDSLIEQENKDQSKNEESNIQIDKKIYIDIIKDLVQTSKFHQYLFIAYNSQFEVIAQQPSTSKLRKNIFKWVEEELLPYFPHLQEIEVDVKTEFLGNFCNKLLAKNIAIKRVVNLPQPILQNNAQIQNMFNSRQRSKIRNWHKAIQKHIINSFELLQNDDNNKPQQNFKRKIKYIPQIEPKEYCEGNMANLSLAQALEQSELYQQQWKDYIENIGQQINYTQIKELDVIPQTSPLKFVQTQIQNTKVSMLLDTGANCVALTRKVVEQLKIPETKIVPSMKIKLANGPPQECEGVINNVIIKIGKIRFKTNIIVTNAQNYEGLLGMNALQYYKAQINDKYLTLHRKNNSYKIELTTNRTSNLNKLEIQEQIFQNSDSEDEQDLDEIFNDLSQEDFKVNNLYSNLPNEKFDLILQEFPIHNLNKNGKDKAKSIDIIFDKLKQLPISQIAKENSIFLLWAIGPQVKNAIHLIQHYGYQYKTILYNWIKLDKSNKPFEGKGTYSKPQSEFLLLGTKGNISKHIKQIQPQVIMAPIQPNFQKPKEIYTQLKQNFNLSQMKNIEIFPKQKHSDKLFRQYTNNQIFFEINTTEISETKKEILQYRAKLISQNSLREQLLNLLFQFEKQFAIDINELELTNLISHDIKLEQNSPPYARSPYRMGEKEREFVLKECQNLEQKGLIYQDVGPWCAAIVIALKQNGSYRMCIDYRKLNSMTIKEKFPIPRIDEIFQRLQQAKYFTKLDAKSCYWQIPLSKRSKSFTGFTNGTYQYFWNSMPFGLTNAPSTCQRGMTKMLGSYLGQFAMVYIDDIIIFSNNEKEHLNHIKIILNLLKQHNLKLGPEKCDFCQTKIELLGHIIDNKQIYPSENKINAVKNISTPTTKKQVRSFLGLASYYRTFIERFTQKAQPLLRIMTDKALFQWGEEQEKSFNILKQALIEKPILNLPLKDAQFIVYTDYSIEGLGAILSQKVAPRKEVVIEYASRTLIEAEKRLDTYQGEILAVQWALNKFRPYIIGNKFLLITDNKAIEWVLKLSTPSRKIIRWLFEIQQYDFEVRHRKGNTHQNVDALSRMACNMEEDTFLNYFEDINDLACYKCKSDKDADKLLICDYCSTVWHTTCLDIPLLDIPKDAWYCPDCLIKISQFEKKDITLDFLVLKYLKEKSLPNNTIEQKRVIKRALHYKYKNDKLYRKTPIGDKLVPTISERKTIIKETHISSGHAGISKTYEILSWQYNWYEMYIQVIKYIKSCQTCNALKPKYNVREDIQPIDKGQRPLLALSIDLITNLPKTKEGYQHIIIVIDAFSKYVIIGKLKSKFSQEASKWFEENIIFTFGKPQIIRSDKGKEFMGAFQLLCNDYCITHHTTSPYYPQSNGQAERTVQNIIKILRAFLIYDYQDKEWSELIPYVAIAINTAPHATTKISPYEILYGTKMIIPDSVNAFLKVDLTIELSDKDAKSYVQKLEKRLNLIHTQVEQQLRIENQQLKERFKNKPKTTHTFQVDQEVFIKKLRTNKLEAKVFGPFKFQRYINNKINCELLDPSSGKIKRYNCNQIAPANQLLQLQNKEQFEVNNLELVYYINKLILYMDKAIKEYKSGDAIPHVSLYTFLEPKNYTTLQIKNQPSNLQKTIISQVNANTIVTKWKYVEGCFLKLTEREFCDFCKHDINNNSHKYLFGRPRHSFVRPEQDGRYYPICYTICKDSEDVYQAYRNISQRTKIFEHFYEMTTEVIQDVKLDFHKISSVKLTKGTKFIPNYEEAFHKLSPMFTTPVPYYGSNNQSVLFLKGVVFQHQVYHATLGKHFKLLTNEVKKEGQQHYKFCLQNGYLNPTKEDPIEDFNEKIICHFESRSRKPVDFIEFFYYFLSPTAKVDLRNWLNQSFEGQILLGKRPWGEHQTIAEPSMKYNELENLEKQIDGVKRNFLFPKNLIQKHFGTKKEKQQFIDISYTKTKERYQGIFDRPTTEKSKRQNEEEPEGSKKSKVLEQSLFLAESFNYHFDNFQKQVFEKLDEFKLKVQQQLKEQDQIIIEQTLEFRMLQQRIEGFFNQNDEILELLVNKGVNQEQVQDNTQS